VYARTGAVRQTRELSGGDGYFEDELIVHFGLGEATQVDELEVRWPSGQVDVLTNVPADQEIRVIEGRGAWYPAPRSIWTVAPPKSVDYGQPVAIEAVCRHSLFEPTAQITSVTGDLSSLGGPSAVPLVDLGDGTYRLSAGFTVGGDGDLRDIEVFVEQQTSLGRHWINLSRNVEVVGQPGTAVTEAVGDGLPQTFTLSQNFPNPFNSSTVIRYSVPVAGAVDLAVYDLLGQRVAQLVGGRRDAGDYAVTWDGRDDRGRAVASGVYLYRLEAGDKQVTRRLALVQ
jgi:flagellar hook assembly protein FlgD